MMEELPNTPTSKPRSVWSPAALNSVLNEAILFAAISIAGTGAAFAFEVGYANWFFRIPVEFIQVDLLRILGSTVMLAVIAIPVLIGVSTLSKFETCEPYSVAQLMFAAMMFATPLLIAAPFLALPYAAVLAALIIGTISFFCFALTTRRYWSAQSRSRMVIPQLTEAVWQRLRPLIGYEQLLIALGLGLAYLAVYCSALAGSYVATLQRSHMVLEDKPQFVLVRRYGDQMIFKEFNPKTGVILDRLEVHTSDSTNPLRLVSMKAQLVAKPKGNNQSAEQ